MVVSAHPVAPSSGLRRGDGLLFAPAGGSPGSPGRGGDATSFVLEVVDLHHRVMPVAADTSLRCACNRPQRRLVLGLVQLVGFLIASSGLAVIQVKRCVGDVDRRRRRPARGPCWFCRLSSVISSNTTVPAGGRVLNTPVLYGQHVGPHWIGHAVVHAVDRVPGAPLRAVVDGLAARNRGWC